MIIRLTVLSNLLSKKRKDNVQMGDHGAQLDSQLSRLAAMCSKIKEQVKLLFRYHFLVNDKRMHKRLHRRAPFKMKCSNGHMLQTSLSEKVRFSNSKNDN